MYLQNIERPDINIIGLDIHSANFTMAVLNTQGKICSCLSRATSAENLIDVVSKVKGPRKLVVEESHLAQWVKSTLEPYVDKLIISDPKENRWIARADFTDDRQSAIKLAQLLMGGYIKEIYHPDDGGAELRSLFIHYHHVNHQINRFKNKLKALYRQVGIKASGTGIYDKQQWSVWKEKLKSYPHLLFQANQLFSLIDSLEEMKEETKSSLIKRAKKFPVYDLLREIPGVGSVIASGYIAMIITPHRFSKKNKLWRYANLGTTYHVSDQVVYKDEKSKTGNRVLKWVVFQHFRKAVHICKSSNRFKQQYVELRSRGLSEKVARRHVCRSLLSVIRAVWMKGESYQDKFYKIID
ncbi:MAG: transposase [Acidobacteriota bacterium]